MALPTGLVHILVFVLTVGIAVPVTLGAELFYRAGGPFGGALRAALLEASTLYIVGIFAVWSIAGGLELWEVASALLVAGAGWLILLALFPLLFGRWLLQRFCSLDPETALRFTTYGWPVAMLAVFAIFLAPGGVAQGDLLSLEGPRTCIAGFCGISVSLLTAVALEAAVATFGPGLVGLVLYTSSSRTRGRRTYS